MPAERLSMRKVREVLRLRWALKLSARQVAGSLAMGRSTVAEYLQRAAAAGLTWEEVEALSDGELEERLFPAPPRKAAGTRPLPDWAQVKKELRGKHVTLYLLWGLCRPRHKPQTRRRVTYWPLSFFCTSAHSGSRGSATARPRAR